MFSHRLEQHQFEATTVSQIQTLVSVARDSEDEHTHDQLLIIAGLLREDLRKWFETNNERSPLLEIITAQFLVLWHTGELADYDTLISLCDQLFVQCTEG